MSTYVSPPLIASTGSFERILGVSSGLVSQGIDHNIIRNEFEEPLALHIPSLIPPDEAYAISRMARSADSDNPPIIPGDIEVPISKRTGLIYPQIVDTVIKSAIESLRHDEETVRGIGYAGIEQYTGDSYPHYDYANLGDIALHGGRLTPNVHLTLSGRGLVRVAQIRDPQVVTDLRDGMAEALKKGMKDRDINANFTSEWIAQQNDARLPDSFKRGIAGIEAALEHASDPVMLYPGDAFIFEGCMQGDCLPVVHDFRTIMSAIGSDEHERTFILFRPQIITLPKL